MVCACQQKKQAATRVDSAPLWPHHTQAEEKQIIHFFLISYTNWQKSKIRVDRLWKFKVEKFNLTF